MSSILAVHDPALLKTIFTSVLGPLPRGVPGEGPDCHVSLEIGGFRPDPGSLVYFYLLCGLNSAELCHTLKVTGRCRNTPKLGQSRSDSLCAGLWAACRVFELG